MKQLICSIFDQKALAYNKIFLQKTKGEALRTMQDLVNDKNTMMSKYPEDFHITIVGYWNEDTGIIETCKPIEFIASGLDFVKESELPSTLKEQTV